MKKTFSLFLLLLSSATLFGQILPMHEKEALEELLNNFGKEYVSKRKVKVVSLKEDKKKLLIYTNEALEDVPFREENTALLYQQIKELYPDYKDIVVYTREQSIESLIPEYFRDGRADKNKRYVVDHKGRPLTENRSLPYSIQKGLHNRHIALWQSHGLYYQQTTPRWEWQRARLFGTVEDLFTQSYVLPFLVPMLENAGANVLIPRERDTQTFELIVDNDASSPDSEYRENDGQQRWRSSGFKLGFAHNKEVYTDGENPFTRGSYRECTTQKKDDFLAMIEWLPTFPEAGQYAVYVSYHTLPNSTDDADYTVYHAGGETRFSINQQMGGGTWIYLGHFYFAEGKSGKVVLSNRSSKNGKIVTADAIKFGGGMGNIARSPKESPYPVEAETSGLPRFTEAARYWLQWAGMPDTLYSETAYENDYRDDVLARGKWVNYLKNELNVPVDLALAFHSDAGITPNDSTIGTLGIYMSLNNDGKYTNKISRETARDLTDLVVTQIVEDVRQTFDPKWTRRGMWNQSYIEARIPDVPTMLLELLSHQNFADMRYGLDPRFRFTVGRAIYKGMLRYVSFQNKQAYVVQPLPPTSVYSRFTGSSEVEIGWQPTVDPLEPTAKADACLLYTRIGEGGFDNGIVVKGTAHRLSIEPGVLYGFKVCALNEGGKSFPSETIAVYRSPQEKGTVLIVNGFDRLSAPQSFDAQADSLAGFLYEADHGVPYLQDISFTGSQYEFRRKSEWVTNDDNGHGDCYNHYSGKVIAGNTFDYPIVHGRSIAAAGYSVVSCSHKTVTEGTVRLTDYPLIDLILGKQRSTYTAHDTTTVHFKAFPLALQQAIQRYCEQGGRLFVSGAYVVSDLQATAGDRTFASTVLRVKHASHNASREGIIRGSASPYSSYLNGEYHFHNQPNSLCYPVEQADALTGAGANTHVVLRYPENNMGAGVVYKGRDYRTFVLGVPFETIQSREERDQLMQGILYLLQSEHN